MLKSYAEQIADGCRNLTAQIPRRASFHPESYKYMENKTAPKEARSTMPLREHGFNLVADAPAIREMVLSALRRDGRSTL